MIQIFEKEKIFHMYTAKISYLIQAEGDSVRNLYFGGAIDGADAASLIVRTSGSSFENDIEAEREEYSLWNGRGFHQPCLRAYGESGRALFGVYQGYEAEEGEESDRLDLLLADEGMGLTVRVRYLLYHDSGMVARSATLTARRRVTLERVMSGAVSLPRYQESTARWTTGQWAGEFRLQESPVRTGVLTLQSRRGITGHHFNPTIALAEPGADENNGRVWFGLLAYSGNWSIQVEKTIFGNTHVVAGINDFDFAMVLEDGQSFETPVFYTGFTEAGFGGMSRLSHRFIREKVLPRQELRPVLYNSWEATAFDVQAEEQKKLAERAARIGCELFVVDDGWFGERHSDRAGLGDWWVNPQKFPQGLSDLVEYVKGLGMRFGIWVEPEAVNPDSDLYRAHPDWIYRYPDQEPVTLRNQYLLNMSLPAVQDYLKGMLHALLSGNDITFIKWDMNRVITDPQSALEQAGKSLWYGHAAAVYRLWQYVREHFPQVEMETCSGGGGRIDLGILRYAEQCWPSDNTDPYTRLFIQEGYTQFYPAAAMMCWVTDSPGGDQWGKRPLSYRFCSAMCGGLGIGSNIAALGEAELSEYAYWIRYYKKWRHIVQYGELYRLLAPGAGHLAAVEYVAPEGDEALVFVFANGLTTDEAIPFLRLKGLDGAARYRLEAVREPAAAENTETSAAGNTGMPTAGNAEIPADGNIEIPTAGNTEISADGDHEQSSWEAAGSTLMNAGLRPDISGDFAGWLLHLKKL